MIPTIADDTDQQSTITLAPGIVLVMRYENELDWRVTAFALTHCGQQTASWGLFEYGLPTALEHACRWRAAHGPLTSVALDLEAEAWQSLPEYLLTEMRAQGLDVRNRTLATAAEANLEDIPPYFAILHPVTVKRVAELIALVNESGRWDFPPVLVVKDAGDGALILDGHHRMAAARMLGLASIPAWVVRLPDYERILREQFGGVFPDFVSDLDDYILVNGRPYNLRS